MLFRAQQPASAFESTFLLLSGAWSKLLIFPELLISSVEKLVIDIKCLEDGIPSLNQDLIIIYW